MGNNQTSHGFGQCTCGGTRTLDIADNQSSPDREWLNTNEDAQTMVVLNEYPAVVDIDPPIVFELEEEELVPYESAEP